MPQEMIFSRKDCNYHIKLYFHTYIGKQKAINLSHILRQTLEKIKKFEQTQTLKKMA